MTDTDRTDPRTRMLDEATAIRDGYTADLANTDAERDALRAELARITTETNKRIRELTHRLTDLRDLRADADALVRSLTPRKPRSDKAPAVDHHAALLDTYDTDTDQ